MPIYEYKCDKCGERFEEIVFGSDSSLACPKCQSKDVERQMSCFASFGSDKGGLPAGLSGGGGGGGCGSSGGFS